MSDVPADVPWRQATQGLLLFVRLTPKSSCDAIEGIAPFGGMTVLKARVRALPEQGRANEALAALIAAWLGVPPSSVSVARGGTSRMKQVLVAGDAKALMARAAASVPD